MKLCIINGSIKQNNNSLVVSTTIQRQAQQVEFDSTIVRLESFSTLFTGEYILFETATPAQRQQLEQIAAADILLFVVPTYYKSMPGGLKNFFDSIRYPEMYQEKIIGFVASNHKNQDYGARHAEEVMKGMLIFFNIQAILLPEIFIFNHENIQESEVNRLLRLSRSYSQYLLK